jgi:hypothetical protein
MSLTLRLILTATICASVVTARAPAAQDASVRLVAIGDIHGALDSFTTILSTTGLIDANGRWSGGRARLVQTGDFTDRGAPVRQVMDLLMRLEAEARRAGGRVEVLFGNHEGMNIMRDTRDVSPEAYATFADGNSESRRTRAFSAHAAAARRVGNEINREEWYRTHPPGYVEYVEAMSPSGKYGRWIRDLKVAIKIDRSVFMHAGIPIDSKDTVEDVNRTVENEIRALDNAVSTLTSDGTLSSTSSLQEIVNAAATTLHNISAMVKEKGELPPEISQDYIARVRGPLSINQWALANPNGFLWYRGYANLPDAAEPQIEALLKRLGADRITTSHTPQLPGRIRSRFGNRLFLIDTGMLTTFYKGGRPSALEIVGNKVTAIYPDEREELVK